MSAQALPADLMDAFASAYLDDPQALQRYVALHPGHAGSFVAYAHEIELQAACRDEAAITADDEAWIAAQVAALAQATAVDPFARLSGADYQAARRELDVPSSVLTAFRDRLVTPASVPLPFLDRLAGLLGVGLAELAAFLKGPPRLAAAVSYKADGAPAAPPEKIPFASVLADADISGDRLDALLDEGD